MQTSGELFKGPDLCGKKTALSLPANHRPLFTIISCPLLKKIRRASKTTNSKPANRYRHPTHSKYPPCSYKTLHTSPDNRPKPDLAPLEAYSDSTNSTPKRNKTEVEINPNAETFRSIDTTSRGGAGQQPSGF